MDGYTYFSRSEGIIKCAEYLNLGKGCKALETAPYSIWNLESLMALCSLLVSKQVLLFKARPLPPYFLALCWARYISRLSFSLQM